MKNCITLEAFQNSFIRFNFKYCWSDLCPMLTCYSAPGQGKEMTVTGLDRGTVPGSVVI